MKKRKKSKSKVFILVVVLLFVLATALLAMLLLKGKGGDNKKPKQIVKEYMEKYKKLDKSVCDDIVYPFGDELSYIQKERYEGIIKFKYERISYYFVEEEGTIVNENDAVIFVKVTSVDIKAAYEKATTYIDTHKEEFETVDDEVEYKLDVISKYDLTEEYLISFNLFKKDGEWKMAELSKSDLDKIKGLF